MDTNLQCYLVTKDALGRCTAGLSQRPMSDLPEGDVLIRVLYSSLNYKDAMAAIGHPGVCRAFPHVPGVDAMGVVAGRGASGLTEGDPVIVTGFDMGANRWGGWSQYVRVPHDWIVPLPDGLSLYESAILGTGGITAGLCIDALQKHGVAPDSGDVVVTGASGGVGSLAVAMLARLGYHVTAVTGKPAAHELLRTLGARQILPREAVCEPGGKPLLPSRFAGGVDTVGGHTLSTLLRMTKHAGCVAACGVVGGHELALTVYPFILRGATLAGIDAAFPPQALRHDIWRRLAGPWKPDHLELLATRCPLSEIQPRIDDILAGRIMGRVVVEIPQPAEASPSP